MKLFDLGQAGVDNRAVARFDVREPLVTPGRDVLLEAEIQQFGGAASNQRVELYIDGGRVSQSEVNVAPNEPGVVTFSHRFSAVGEHTAEIRLSDDATPLDNRRWLSIPVRPTVRVLCIQGKPDAAKFVSLALQPKTNRSPARLGGSRRRDSAVGTRPDGIRMRIPLQHRSLRRR